MTPSTRLLAFHKHNDPKTKRCCCKSLPLNLAPASWVTPPRASPPRSSRRIFWYLSALQQSTLSPVTATLFYVTSPLLHPVFFFFFLTSIRWFFSLLFPSFILLYVHVSICSLLFPFLSVAFSHFFFSLPLFSSAWFCSFLRGDTSLSFLYHLSITASLPPLHHSLRLYSSHSNFSTTFPISLSSTPRVVSSPPRSSPWKP